MNAKIEIFGVLLNAELGPISDNRVTSKLLL